MGEVQKQAIIPSHPREPENLPCPRCDSTNTKFCYYNNYNLSQPRYYCKACRRYWTRGGTLRNIPVGGASRKSSKRSRLPPPSSAARQEAPPCEVVDLNLSEGSSFTSLLTCESVSGLGVGFGSMSGFEEMGFGLSFGPMVMEANDGDGMEGGDCCFGWPDLAISTPRNGVDRVV